MGKIKLQKEVMCYMTKFYGVGVPIPTPTEDGVFTETARDRAKRLKNTKTNLTTHSLTIEEHKKRSKKLGGFYFLKHSNNTVFTLNAPTVGRLIYLATYMGYENKLFLDNNHVMLKKNLSKILRVSLNCAKSFYEECVSSGVLIDAEKDGLYLFEDFYRGKSKDKERVKVYKNSIREVYEKLPSSSHKYFGYVVQLLPYINVEYNVICKNPQEKDAIKIQPYTLAELCDIWGYDYHNAKRFLKMVSKCNFIVDGIMHPLFAFIKTTWSGEERTYAYINQFAIYYGTHISKMDALVPVFSNSQNVV